jgi:Domain of unknown function (DUF4275)
MIYEFGKWKIDIDTEGTRKYYESLNILPNDLEAWNNYCLYLERLKPEEKKFFEDLGIEPHKCDVNGLGFENGIYPTYGRYLIKGNYLEVPEEKYMLLEDFVENGVPNDIEEERNLQVGIFEFEFLTEDGMFHPAPKDTPTGFVCLEFMVEELPWILPVKPHHIMPASANWWQPIKKMKQMIHNRKIQIEEEHKTLQSIIWDLKTQNIPFRIMKKSQVNVFKKYWLYMFAPEENYKNAKKVCITKWNYLWHLFSYEYVDCRENLEAIEAYKTIIKSDCYLYLSYFDIGIKIRKAEDFIWENKDIYEDFVITDKDFNWTFAKTHEEQCGPYFFQSYEEQI